NFFFEACGFIRSLLSAVLCSRCLPPTCIILHAFSGDVNTFLKKFFDFSMYAKAATLLRDG
ncbi:hypothetical protein, partial [uncultured Selenomonas sp.]|uniref:hypothetical protein n=1 Tax=uncultured Selenomonas sp. TaxID=159275 RepID=UPI0025F77330